MEDDVKRFPAAAGMRFLPIREFRKLEPVATRAAEGDERARYEVAVSSEYEVERYGWFGKWREVLDHSAESVQLERFTSGRAAVLEEHRGAPVGVIESARIDDDRVLRAVIVFSRTQRGQDVERDFVDGIRGNISVGYIPKRAKLVEEDEEKGDLWRMTQWEPMELSSVGVPADPTVGVGRDANGGGGPPIEIEADDPPKEDRNMKRHLNAGAGGGGGTTTATAERDHRAEAREIHQMASDHGFLDRVDGWLDRGLTPNEVGREILNLKADRIPKRTQPASEVIDVPEKDRRGYSYARAILAASELREGHDGKGLEWEMHRELERHSAGMARKGGLLIPASLGLKKRALDTKTGGKGAELTFEQAGDVIELLRNQTAAIRLGARVITGLTAPVTFPKQSGAIPAKWVGENPPSPITKGDMSFALAQFAPKTLMGATSFSRQLLVEGAFDTEEMVRDDLSAVHSIAVDLAVPHGLGAAGEPTGIYKAAGVSVTAVGGAMSYAKVVAMEGQVATANAMLGTLGWLMNPTMSANLKQVHKATNTYSPVWEGPITEGVVDGYRAIATNQISKVMSGSEFTGGSEIGAIFGNWRDVLIGFWFAMELIVDPYTAKQSGLIEVTSFQMADILIRHGESFSKATGATA
jgi:HK97 family phage major capsid protein